MQWYYSKNGTQLGPVPQVELQAKIASGEISASDLVWKEGMGDWIPSAQVAELRGAVPAAPVSLGGSPTAAVPVASPYSAPSAPLNPAELIPNYLWQSIVVTLLCCLPFGIVAIINAAKVDGLRAAGDLAGARTASANAKKWAIYSLIGWAVAVVLYIGFIAIVGVTAASNGGLQPQ